MLPDRLVEKARKIPEQIASSLDPIMNRNTLLTFGGMGAFIGLSYLELLLHSKGVDFGLPPRLTLTLAILPPALPIFKGVIGNTREYLSPSKVFNLAKSHRDIGHMLTAGMSLHSAGEYAQALAIILGGADFATNWPGSDLNAFLFNPHNLPYWSLNVPGFFLIGKAGVSQVARFVSLVREQI